MSEQASDPFSETRIEAEFDEAKAAGTTRALNTFIAHHAGHPLAADAIALRDRILQREGRPIPVGPEPAPLDPDRAVRDEFAGAASRNSADAYALFIARHPDHALAEEARRRLDALRKP